MKALRWYDRKYLSYEDAPELTPGPGQVKIKVSLAGICGSDLKVYTSGFAHFEPYKVPITIGHEFSGRVVALGKGVKGFKEGDRVSGVGNSYCGECYVCKKGLYNLCVNQGMAGITFEGCMADYFVLPAYSCYKLPDSVSDEMGALVEPLAVALHAVRQARVRIGDTLAIVGDGTIGLCALLAAQAAGAAEVYVISKYKGRGGLAKKLGAKKVIYSTEGNTVKKIQDLTGGIGTNAAIECAGRPASVQLAVELVQRGGIAVVAGVFEQVKLDFGSVTPTERMIVGSSIYVDEGQTAIALMAGGHIDPSPLISSIVPLQDAQKGFEALISDRDKNLKVLLRVA